jgi:formate dehydrogenase subunit gamma
MYFPELARLSWRTGATLVHDWFALGLGLLVVGHIGEAVRDAEARRGMRTGVVRRDWALREHRDWVESMGDETPDTGPELGPVRSDAT